VIAASSCLGSGLEVVASAEGFDLDPGIDSGFVLALVLTSDFGLGSDLAGSDWANASATSVASVALVARTAGSVNSAAIVDCITTALAPAGSQTERSFASSDSDCCPSLDYFK